MEAVLAQEGLPAALADSKRIYTLHPGAGEVCHLLTHYIGAAAYAAFAETQELSLSPDLDLCGYGFYHGFTERMLDVEGTAARVEEFCKKIEERLGEKSSSSCYHGIGHGAVNAHDPKLWGEDLKVIGRGLDLCAASLKESGARQECYTGVFSGLATFYTTGEYGMTIRPEDPMWVCRAVSEQYRLPCYGSMPIALSKITENDFSKIVGFAEGLPDRYGKEMVTYAAGVSIYSNLKKTDLESLVKSCREAVAHLTESCLAGVFASIRESATASSADVCGSALLREDERNVCLNGIPIRK